MRRRYISPTETNASKYASNFVWRWRSDKQQVGLFDSERVIVDEKVFASSKKLIVVAAML